jgi:TonB-dependent starch-binding outer membrane protein SusC
MKRKRLLAGLAIPLLLLLSFTSVLAQNKTISGKVSDSKDGSPIPGVSVMPKGSTKGTTTGADGVFHISVGTQITALIFSSVGFSAQEVAIGNNDLQVKLVQVNNSLGEIVVIGYGTARKKDLTGSISTVSSKDFQQGAITTPEQLISGKVAGVSITSNGGAPGSGSVIRIRGGASLNASNDPLIVIDGMPIENASISGIANPLSLINPNDIETFTVLKDASAAAIYGSRASNGVIIITTKKGRSGKPVLNFNTQLSAGSVAKKVDVLSPDQIRQIVTANGTPSLVALLGSSNTDWQNQIYQTAISNDNNLSIAGALKNLPYRVSLGYLNQNGVLKTDNLQRTSLGVNISPVLLDNHLKIDLNLKGSYSNVTFANQGAIGSAVSFDPTQSVYNTKSTRFGGYWEWLDPNSSTGLKALSPKNPLGLLEEQADKSTVKRSVGNAVIDYKVHFLPELHAIVTLGYDISEGRGTKVISDSAASNYDRFKDPNGVFHGGVNTQYKQTKQNTYLNYSLTYAKDLKSIDSRIEALAGYEYQDYLTTNYNYPDVTYDGTVVSSPTFPFDKPENRLISYLGRATYTFMNRYILTGSIRRDGSSKFSPANRWGNFPSGAFAWKIKNESFLSNVSAVSDLKIRVGYGVTGQQDGINDYDYQSFYNLSTTTAEYQFGNNFYQMFRPGGYYLNRKWEQTATTNVAIDYGFMNNRISGSIEYYYRNTTNLLNNIPQPAGTNFSNYIVANIGSMENKGVEFTINLQPIRTKNVTWDVAFNATYNENKITKLTISNDPNYAGTITGPTISGGTGNQIQINSIGFSRASFYVFKQIYDSKSGKPIDGLFEDINRDGIINNSDLYKYKSSDPKEFFGFSTNLAVKKWSAGFVLRANFGNYMYNNVASSTGTLRNILNPVGFINNASTDFLNTNFSGNGTNYYQSDYYVQNASFLRMDNFNIGYNVGKVFSDKASLRLSANVQNVFVITKYKGLDPEISGGIDNNFYPRPRTFVLGLNLNF